MNVGTDVGERADMYESIDLWERTNLLVGTDVRE